MSDKRSRLDGLQVNRQLPVRGGRIKHADELGISNSVNIAFEVCHQPRLAARCGDGEMLR